MLVTAITKIKPRALDTGLYGGSGRKNFEKKNLF